MDWIITTILCLSAAKAVLCFNIEPMAWKTLTENAAGFGYQVVQRKSDLLVSAPLDQYLSDKRGQIFSCSTESCTSISEINTVPNYAVNMSLGLTLASDPSSKNTLACGPTIPKDCKSITMYSGLCLQIDSSNRFLSPLPSTDKECRIEADIAFLLDGSGSVAGQDFRKMKEFVKKLVESLFTKYTQFAIVQFSSRTVVHYYFNTFFSGSWRYNVDSIRQLTGGTYTATAIRNVVDQVFTQTQGSRPNVKKVLIVITDGESQERSRLPSAAAAAQAKGIVRFAIGVGDAFSKTSAKEELNTIASSPSVEHVFQVENFDALDKISQSLQTKIFSIEGSQSGGESLQMEMAQEGFSAAFVPGGIQMGMVGANQWTGGYMQYTNRESSFELPKIEPDSYLGYSMAVAKTIYGPLTITGGPRYQHRGVVVTVYNNRLQQVIHPPQGQIQSGEYFGAEVCAMDVDRNSYTDLILISAPMYKESDREGLVYVCSLNSLIVECLLDSPLLLRGAASAKARFGSSLAVLPDLNTDGLSDLAVGAPLENDGQGSIYIFHGEAGGRINPTYSQRIAGSEVQPGLKLFGISISQSTFDQSGDKLPDLAVGSKGSVVLLRSRPIVMVTASVTFRQNQIPTQNNDCSKLLNNVATICFTMTSTAVNTGHAMINYTFTLDATRKVPNNRASFSNKQRESSGSITISLTTPDECVKILFAIEPCPEDSLNALSNELKFTFDGVSSDPSLKLSLHQQAQTTTFHPLDFEVNCGSDGQCVDNLKLDFNFTSSSEIKVGIDELLDVTISVENRGENSYNSHIILTYPRGLSYRKFTALNGRVECNSLDSEGGFTRGKTDCTVNRPIFKTNAMSLFIVSYGLDTNSQLDKRISVTANATSGNQKHDSASELYKIREIDVKYSILITFESSLSYSNFTSGKNDLQKPFQQLIKVTNHIRAINFTVVIRVPVRLGDKDIWADSSNLQIKDCQRKEEEEPVVKDFVAQIQKNKAVDCSVARCRVFKCTMFMGRLESKEYQISANLSSRWIGQIGLEAAKFLLTSTASLEYDTNQYIFFSTGSNNNPPIRKIEAEVEVYPEPDFTKEIVGGSLGGLALLVLLTAGLYKAGFFKSKYKEMINEAGEGADAGDGGAAAAPE